MLEINLEMLGIKSLFSLFPQKEKERAREERESYSSRPSRFNVEVRKLNMI